MKEISEYLKKNNIISTSYRKLDNVIIVDTNIGKLVIKKNKPTEMVYNYLNSRNFNYYPDVINNDKYFITKYEEDIKIPDEQKIMDIIDITSLLHAKTTHYKNVCIDDYKKIYEDLSNNFEYLYSYYLDIISVIDDQFFYSPSENLFAINVDNIFNSINLGKELTEQWLDTISEENKMRMSVVHNNLDLTHYIRNEKEMLISWNKSKIDIPIFDLYILYNKYYDQFDFIELLKRYQNNYPLKKYELELFLILIIMPNIIEFNDTEYNTCIKITKEINRLNISRKIVLEYKNYFK